ncbi:MAG TPA: hypothetical protein VL986_08590 [Terracidiphilus sp.]|nr:hypothetical protein [Terracidiphilus sp.]
MLSPEAPHNGNSFLILDLGTSLICIALAWALPNLGRELFSRIERAFVPLARRKSLAVAVAGASVFLLRLAILPLFPIPRPFVPDDFSFLLAANTFASGRLANPTPAMWRSFETIHVTMKPTYMSMYFPGQGLLLAAGKVLFGNPWIAVLIASAFMCAALCWALQAWLPANWAFFGGLIAVVRLGIFTCWTNTYHAGGALTAMSGALVIGSLPRLMKTARLRYAMLMGIGIAILILTRPFEGMLLCLPVAVALGHWVIKGKNRPPLAVLFRRACLPVAVFVAAGLWLAYYDLKAFGNPFTLPYTVDRNTYAVAPYYIWQHARPIPVYSNPEMRRFYTHDEFEFYAKMRTPAGFVSHTLLKIYLTFLFYAGYALLLPLIMIRRVFLDKRIRFLVLCCLVLLAGMSIEIYLLPHYVAPFTVVFYAIGLQCMRHLRVFKSNRQRVGLALVRTIALVIVLMAGLRLIARPLGIGVPMQPTSGWNSTWFGPERYGDDRVRVEAQLDSLPGPQLAVVRYGPNHDNLNEWVYNAPDIDNSKVVWARELDPADNKELIDYYRNRTVWLVEPDADPVRVSPYPDQVSGNSGAH